MPNIIYLHGMFGRCKSRKIDLLRASLPDYTIIVPELSNINLWANIDKVNKLAEECSAKAIIGTSLGGFTTLMVDSVRCLKLVHNPCLEPSRVLPDLAAERHLEKLLPQIVLDKIRALESRLPLPQDRNSTWGLFGTRDEVLGSYHFIDEFNQWYSHPGVSFEGGHYLNRYQMGSLLVPAFAKAMAEYNEEIKR
jgi:predicted esterase YcpF (UPF0227 family)